MSRSALRLAALANAVVPGLAPASAQGVAVEHGDLYEFAFVMQPLKMKGFSGSTVAPTAIR